MSQHEFHYCRAVEIPHPVVIPEHDDFAAGLELNYEELEQFDLGVADYAKALARAALGTEITVEHVKPDLSLVPESNVFYLEDYQDGRLPAA